MISLLIMPHPAYNASPWHELNSGFNLTRQNNNSDIKHEKVGKISLFFGFCQNQSFFYPYKNRILIVLIIKYLIVSQYIKRCNAGL